MKQAIARKWAKALESGEYKQTTGELHNAEGFCCLGVLCNLHAQDNPEMAANENNPHEYFGEDTELPFEVMSWAGMSSVYGAITGKAINVVDEEGELLGSASTLIDLNDGYEQTFPEIAKVIRKHWKEL